MAKEAQPSQPLSLSSMHPAVVRVRQGVELPGRGSLKRFECAESRPQAFHGDAGGFDISFVPVGVMLVDLKQKGRFLIPWVNVDSVQLETDEEMEKRAAGAK